MRGHVRKRGSKWAAVVYVGKDSNGKDKYKWFSGFETERDAEVVLAQKVNELHIGTYMDLSDESFSVFLDKWLVHKESQVRERTIEIYRRTIRLHIEPHIGHIPVGQLKPAHLRDLYSRLAKTDKLSNRYIGQIHTMISDALTRAVKWEMVPRNVAQAVDAPKPKRKKFDVWSLDDTVRFLNAPEVKEHRFYIAFLLALTTGMRQGEILGLQWPDIDWDDATIHVQRTLTWIRGSYSFGPPKSESGERYISLPPEVVDALKAHRAKQNEWRLLAGKDYHNHDLVVARHTGKIVTQTFLRQKFTDLISKLNMPYIRFHDLRHTHASILLELGEKTKVLQERLGHSDYSTTMDIYTHVSKRLQHNTAQLLSTGLFGAK